MSWTIRRRSTSSSDIRSPSWSSRASWTSLCPAQRSTKPVTFTREQAGWIWKEDRAEQLGKFQADFYSVNGMILESRKRREHLSEEDLQKNKAIIDSFSKGNTKMIDNETKPEDVVRRESLAPPNAPSLTLLPVFINGTNIL